MAFNTKLPIVTDGLIFSVDPYNKKSYVSGDTTCNIVGGVYTGGTLNNGVTYDDFSWGFNGTDQSIDFGNILNQSTNDFTISTWVKLVDNGLAVSVIVSKRENSIPFTGYELRVSSSGLPTLILDGPVNDSNRFSSVAIYDDTWHNITAVFNVSGDVLDVYTDGILTNGSSANSPLAVGSVDNIIDFYIGQRGNDFWVEGGISSVLMYNRVLTPSEIKQNYNALKYRFI